MKKKKGFGIFFEESKISSGQRFFKDLHKELVSKTIDIKYHPEVILFNVSAPIKEILKAKFFGQKIILRIDSLYFDKVSMEFIKTFKFPLRFLFHLMIRLNFSKKVINEIANFFEQNYSSFARIILADLIVYQSHFSKKIHQRYFPNKPNVVIVNGTSFKATSIHKESRIINSYIKLVTTYDGFRPSKRIDEIVNFVKWVKIIKGIDIELTIIGYDGKKPLCTSDKMITSIENENFIKTLPRFKDYNDEVVKVLKSSDVYISFSYRDACPNAIIEAMSFGLPVLAIKSGGLPDIIGSAGELIENSDFENGFFSSHRFSCDFPKIDYNVTIKALNKILQNLPVYNNSVKDRFKKDLEIKLVAKKYFKEINKLIN